MISKVTNKSSGDNDFLCNSTELNYTLTDACDFYKHDDNVLNHHLNLKMCVETLLVITGFEGQDQKSHCFCTVKPKLGHTASHHAWHLCETIFVLTTALNDSDWPVAG